MGPARGGVGQGSGVGQIKCWRDHCPSTRPTTRAPKQEGPGLCSSAPGGAQGNRASLQSPVPAAAPVFVGDGSPATGTRSQQDFSLPMSCSAGLGGRRHLECPASMWPGLVGRDNWLYVVVLQPELWPYCGLGLEAKGVR